MQIIDYPLAVACLVERRAGIDVLHSVTHSVIEQDCDLARRSRHRLGLADARREPPVECAQRGVGPSNSYGSKAQERQDSFLEGALTKAGLLSAPSKKLSWRS